MNEAKDVLVIGAGVVGLCTAWHAAKRGFKVTVVDRGPAGSADGCAFGSAGMIVPSHFVPLAAPGMVRLGLKWMWNPESPFHVKPRLSWDLAKWGWFFNLAATKSQVAAAAPLLSELSLASRAGFETMSDELGFDLQRRGLLMLCQTAHALDEEAKAAAQAQSLGIPAEVLDAKQSAARDPHVTMNIQGSVYYPLDCHLNPGRFMAALRQGLEELSVRFVDGAAVTGWRLEGNRIVAAQTTRGDLKADEFALCGGVWSSDLVRPLGLQIPMQAGKGYSVTLPQPRELPDICSIFVEARVAATPMDGALRIGGTMELAGIDTRINPARVRGLLKSVPRYFPAFRVEDFQDLPVWRGLRPCSPDGLPYVGRFGHIANLSTATGHAMMGLSLGPVTGQIMADIISRTAPSFDLRLLSPDRYL